jgi:hypothetical protein
VRRFGSPIALAAVVFAAGPAAGVDLARLEALSVRYAGFLDDFEDGIFPDGGAGEPLRYFLPCGEVGDADETGGRLTLAGPDPTCGLPGFVGESVAGFFAAAGDVTVTATFVEAVPATQQGYGVTLAGPDGTDFASLSFARSAVPPLSDDALVVVLVDENFSGANPVAINLVTANAGGHAPGAVIELSLSITRSDDSFVPSGEYRRCPTWPCGAVAFTPVPSFGGGGELAAGEFHGLSLTVADVSGSPTPTPFSFEVEELRVEYAEVADDFGNGVLDDPYPYLELDGSAAEIGGALVLRDDAFPGFALRALDASLPAPTSPTARYRFALPAPCASHGVSTGITSGGDFVSIELARRPLPGVGDDVLQVVARSESEGAEQPLPVFERAVISAAPLGDPALAGVTTIELGLEVAEEVASPPAFPTLRAHGSYRLCATPDCVGAELHELETVTEPPDDPEAELCGLTAASFAPPPDGGVIDGGPPLGTSFFAVPEPGAPAGRVAALLAALGLARLRRRDRVRPTPGRLGS